MNARRLILATVVALAALAVPVFLLGASVASADSCANAVFRSGPSANLPDCRAYELVTPPFKNGGIPFGQSLLDGSHVVLSSLGAFGEPGDNEGANGSNYVITREEASGWSSVPIDPPASLFQNAGRINVALEDVSQDFGKALFAEFPVSSTKSIDLRYYVRQPDGSFVEIGPTVPPKTIAEWTPNSPNQPSIRYAGASRDLKHVFFKSSVGGTPTDFLWPGDTTIRTDSLYEYVGTGHTGLGTDVPTLVGVNNNGELISQCGTTLGASTENGESGDAYNAISEQGTTVFFTANQAGCSGFNGEIGAGPVANELYARIDGSKTVAVSEPSLSVPGRECTGACMEDENEENGHKRSEGIFQGASQDGSKVFFLTKQPLVNGDENGEGTGQDLYGAEVEAGAVKKLIQVSHDPNPGEAAEVQGVTRVSEEGTRVYFVAKGVLAGNEDAKNEIAKEGDNNLYVYEPDPEHTGQYKTVFIAALASSDNEDWNVSGGRPVAATPDGRFLLFTSTNDLTPDAQGTGAQLYRYDAQEEKLVRVSIGENGFHDNEGTAFSIVAPGYASSSVAATGGGSISDDGSYVFFSSQEGLTEQALNNRCIFESKPGKCAFAVNVYEYHEGHVYLISDGQDTNSTGAGTGRSVVSLLGASPSGHDVFFTTGDRLVAQDTDTQQDVYDARIGGGFPAPAAPASCQGDECQGPLSQTPPLLPSSSASLVAEGNLAPPVSKPAVKPKPELLTRAQKRAKALKACAKKPKKRRAACVKQAKKWYAVKSKAKRSNRKGK